MATRITLRLDFDQDRRLGPGKIALLEAIQNSGSISGAGRKFGMAYRRAWLLLQDIEKIFGGSILDRRTDGKFGGGAALTSRGRDIVKYYRNAERRAARAIKADLDSLAKIKN